MQRSVKVREEEKEKVALDLRKSESKMTKLENQIHELEDAIKQLESDKVPIKMINKSINKYHLFFIIRDD